MSDYGFGWKPPDDERKLKDFRYPFSLLNWTAPETVNSELAIPDLWDYYNQGSTPRCVAFSSQFMSSIYAYNYHLSLGFTPAESLLLVVKYDTSWLWKAIGGTSQGAMIEDSLDVLRKGDVIAGTTKQVLREGIQNYVHIKNAEDLRVAASNGSGGLLGTPWHEGWTDVKPNSEGIAILNDNPKTWGRIVGYHAIDWSAWLDMYDGTRVNNSWGAAWNKGAKVIMTRKAIDYMLSKERFMGCVVTDIPVEPLPPPPPPTEKDYIDIQGIRSTTGKHYSGRLTEV